MGNLRNKFQVFGKMNPKTSWAGIIVAGLSLMTAFGWITPEQAAAISGLAVAFGLLAAKDGDK